MSDPRPAPRPRLDLSGHTSADIARALRALGVAKLQQVVTELWGLLGEDARAALATGLVNLPGVAAAVAEASTKAFLTNAFRPK